MQALEAGKTMDVMVDGITGLGTTSKLRVESISILRILIKVMMIAVEQFHLDTTLFLDIQKSLLHQPLFKQQLINDLSL